MTFSPKRFLGPLFVSALAVGAFGFGLHLSAPPSPGRNLLPRTAAAPAPADGLTLTATTRGIGEGSRAVLSRRAQAEGGGVERGPGATFRRVYLMLQQNYVETLPPDPELGHGAAAAMLSSLGDPDSRFLEASDLAELKREMRGEYHGLGAALAVRKINHPKNGELPAYPEYQLTIVAPLPGSPAEKAGLKTGDVLTDIGGQWIAAYDPVAAAAAEIKAAQKDPVALTKLGKRIQAQLDGALSLSKAQSKLSVSADKPLALKVRRPGQAAPLSVSVDLTPIVSVQAVSAKLLPANIGYVKIALLTENAAAEFDKALLGLGTGLKGLIVDLRQSPGGTIAAGQAVAARLTTSRVFGVVQSRSGFKTLTLAPNKTLTCPITVLTDGGTASTSELVAAALQAGGARLVGAKTFGDASDVEAVPLRDGSGFTMTVGRLLTPSKTEFAQAGLAPDILVPAVPGRDAVLERAVSELTTRLAARLP